MAAPRCLPVVTAWQLAIVLLVVQARLSIPFLRLASLLLLLQLSIVLELVDRPAVETVDKDICRDMDMVRDEQSKDCPRLEQDDSIRLMAE